ncbi:MAG TPA: dethiobiotin synthase [Candidatus Sulfotelmatobacter sp.]|jgi:dethiobiotin synthetase|nr:dethiobiotin synthase [Candidatus Sulfotelmatobacter sp.]
MKKILFITGTDTGAGKTVLTALLAEFLCTQKIKVAALKPVCSGGRGDAEKIFTALGGRMDLDGINPWHFRDSVAPSLAARREKRPVKLAQVVAHVRAIQNEFDAVLIEGAGGLLSPLGENFDSRDLIVKLDATPVIVAANKLGAVNHILLTLEALPKKFRVRSKVVLMSPARPDTATGSNAELLGEFVPLGKFFKLPWLGKDFSPTKVLREAGIRRTLGDLV